MINSWNTDGGPSFGRYGYNNKESQIDLGWRQYDPTTAMFPTIDPMAEKYIDLSTYSFVRANLISRVDYDGADWFRDEDGNYIWNITTGKTYTDTEGKEWQNAGTSYTHYNQDGSAIYFYQNEDENGDLSLASHNFSRNEMAVFGLFHSEGARQAAMENHVKPGMASFLRMVGK